MTACRLCGERVEPERECYAVPTCYECLPPPDPLPVRMPRVIELDMSSRPATPPPAQTRSELQLEVECMMLRALVREARGLLKQVRRLNWGTTLRAIGYFLEWTAPVEEREEPIPLTRRSRT